jgi:hypothetical protein
MTTRLSLALLCLGIVAYDNVLFSSRGMHEVVGLPETPEKSKFFVQ